jgi:hypothetical protein
MLGFAADMDANYYSLAYRAYSIVGVPPIFFVAGTPNYRDQRVGAGLPIVRICFSRNLSMLRLVKTFVLLDKIAPRSW